MKRALWQESFVPVLLILLVIFIALLFVEYKVNEEEDSFIRVQIPVQVDDVATDGEGKEELVSTVSSSPDRDKLFSFIAQKRWADAESFARAKLMEAETSEMLTYLALIYGKQKQYEKMNKMFDRALASQPVFSGVYFYRGTMLAKQKKYEAAVASYQQQIELVPYHFEAHYNLALAQQKLKQYEDAVVTLKKALGLASGKRKAKTYYSLGRLQKRLNLMDEAKKSFVAAIRLRPDYPEPRFGLATLYFGQPGGLEKAMLEYQMVLKLKPNYAPVYFQEGLAYSSFAQYELASKAYEKAIQLNPAYKKARYNLGLQLIRLRQWDRAKQQFQWILQRQPEHAKSYFNLARIAAGQGNIEQALKHYKKAVMLRNNDYPEAYVNMGLLFVDQTNYKQAFEMFDKAIQLRPQYASAWYSLGLAKLQAGDSQQAEELLKKALTYNPKHLQAWDILAGIYLGESKRAKAIEAYQHVLALDAQNKEALFSLADIYVDQESYQKAKSLYLEVLKTYPMYALAWQKLGYIDLKIESFEDAERELRRAIELDDEMENAKALLAALLMMQGRRDEAVHLYQGLVDADPANAALRLAYAKALIEVSDVTAAKIELEKARRLEPDNLEIKEILSHL